jgi:hypothetical protein
MGGTRFTRGLLAAALWLPLAALSQEPAFTNRSTELKERGANEARTVATLAENTPVKVLARGGGWTQVEAGGQSGWLRVFHLRFASTVEKGGGSALSGLTAALGMGSRDRKANVATTGVRGLSEEELKNASPDREALRRLQSYRADRAAAERFAREAKLAAVPVDDSDKASGNQGAAP